MSRTLKTAPTTEPLSLADVKMHLRLDSGSLADNVTVNQSITPGSHAIAAGYSLQGSSADVLGSESLVVFDAGTCGSGGTVDVKIQESDNDSTWSDWHSFSQVSESNDDQIYEKEYTGTKQYVRAVATVASAACEFGVSVHVQEPDTTEDSYLSSLITVARTYAEEFTRRAFITQTWERFADSWPKGDSIELPRPPLQSVTSVKYKDEDGTESTLASSKYIVDTDGLPGKVVLDYGESWPSLTYYPINAITVEYVAGYGDSASDVPEPIRHALKLIVGHWYENRETVTVGTGNFARQMPWAAETLLWTYRVL